MTAESFHDPLVRLAWRFIKGGMAADRVIETLQGLLLAVPEPHDDRWQERFDEVERTVTSAAAKQFRPALDIILDWMQRRYQPGHRNPDQSFYSIALGVDVPLGKIYADREVLDALRFATETPRDKGRVKESQLPTVFRRHKEGAYGELLKSLSPRDAEAVVGTAEELKVMVTNLLACAVLIEHGGRVCNASLGSWIHTFADLNPDKWCRVKDLPAWGRHLADGLEIAILPELAARVKTCPAIAAMSKTMLTRQCNAAGLCREGTNHIWTEDGQIRATVLSAEFVGTLGTVNIHHDVYAEILAERLATAGRASKGGSRCN